MSKRVKVSELPDFDAAEYLNSEADMAAYLTTVLEENDPARLAAACVFQRWRPPISI